MKNDIPFSEFSLKNMILIRGTPPCTPHMEVPPADPAIIHRKIRHAVICQGSCLFMFYVANFCDLVARQPSLVTLRN